jgi:hypothetical protein
VIDSETLLVEICGAKKVAAFKEVKLTSMRLARVVKEVIAEELHGDLPPRGKQFLTTSKGKWRLATRPNSDNTTEELAHKRMGARLVQVFGEVDHQHQARGWLTIDELYAIHGARFDSNRMLKKLGERLS